MNPGKRKRRNLLLFVLPYLLMVITNEWVRPGITEKPYSEYGVTAMNSADRMKHKCSWACHNDTRFCQNEHSSFLQPFFSKTDPVYYGEIGLLMSTGAYGAANLLVFVVLLPLLIWFLLTRALNMQGRINALKKQL